MPSQSGRVKVIPNNSSDSNALLNGSAQLKMLAFGPPIICAPFRYRLNVSDVPKLKRDGIISGGMIPKIDCCVEAVRRGVERAHIIDGRTPHSILVELFTDEGIGTMFY